MGKLPPGVVIDGDEVHIDLRIHTVLAELDGVLELPAADLILVRGKHKIRAFCSFCPHKPKKERRVVPVEGTDRPTWVCDHHSWTWDRRGRPTGVAEAGLDRYETEVVGSELIVRRA